MAALKNDRNEFLYTSSSRVTGASVSISSGVVSSIVVPKNTSTPVPSSITLTANVSGYTNPTYSWSYRFGNSGNFSNISGSTSTISINTDSTWLVGAGTNTSVEYKVEVQETNSNLGVNISTVTKSISILREGTDAFNNVIITLYKRTATNEAPTVVTSNNSTYTFSTGQVVGQPSGWSQTIPSSTLGAFLWTIQVAAASISTSYVFANTLWSAPTLYVQDGITNSIVYAYKRSSTAPTDNPGPVDYNLVSNTITTATLANSWQKSIPTGTDPLYVVSAFAKSSTNSDSIAAAEWSTPVILTQNGLNTAAVFLYARNSSISSAPAVSTSGASTYTFSTGVLSGYPAGWSQSIPAQSNGTVIWVIQATALSAATTDTIANSEWSTPQVLSQIGDTGIRGSRQLYTSNPAYDANYQLLPNAVGAASYAVQATNLISTATTGSVPTTPIRGDTVTFSNGSNYVYTITYNPATPGWEPPGTVIDGSLLVTGSVTAAKINSNGLSIRDANGNIILSAGNPLDWGNVTNQPADIYNSNIAIGGTNLVTGTGTGTGWTQHTSFTATNTFTKSNSVNTEDYFYSPYFACDGSAEVTISFEAYCDSAVSGVEVFILPNDYVTTGLLNWNYGKYTGWTKLSKTFTTPAGWGAAKQVRLRFDHNGSTSGTTNIYIRNIKFEKGNKATDWVPNPEEMKNTNITVDSSGVLQGTGTSNVVVNNQKITVDSSGILQGTGTSNVVVNNSFLDTLTFTTTNVTVIGNTVKKTGPSAWTSQAYSKESYTTGAFASFSPDSSTSMIAVGLNTDPAANASYDSIDYAWFLDHEGNAVFAESGNLHISNPTIYSAGDIFSITYDGSNVRYYHNGVLKRTIATTITAALYFDSALYTTDASISKIKFGPMSSNNWNQITNQPAGIYNENITVDSSGILQGTGTSNVVVNNQKITVDGSGVLQGTGTPNVVVNNQKITVDSTGVLQGTGTPNVVVNNSFLDTLTFTTTNVTVIGNTVKKTGGSPSTWDSQAYSKESYTTGAFASFSPDQANAWLMAGLNTDPATNASYDSIDYAWYCVGDGDLRIYESGYDRGDFGSYSAGDILSITYDGSNIRYYQNGVLKRTIVATITAALYFDSSIYTSSATISKIKFGPMSSNNWNQITNQPAGIYNHNISIQSNGTLLNGAGTGGSVTIGGLGYTGALNATFGKSLGLPFEKWNIGTQTIETITDGKVGNKVLRLAGRAGVYPNQGNYIPIDRTKKYRTRFWARPSSNNTSGLLYFSLRQFLDSAGATAGPVNGGRSPHKPSGQSPSTHNSTFGAQAWGEYSYVWGSSDWQAGVAFVQPEFLDNYSGQVGHWDVQDFTFEEVTEVLSAATTATWSGVTGAGKPADSATKNTIFRQDAAPAAEISAAGDIWFKTTSTGLSVHYFDGTNWQLAGDKTSQNTAASITGQGAMATLDKITTTNYSTYIESAVITNLFTNELLVGKTIKSADNKMVMDFANKYISITV